MTEIMKQILFKLVIPILIPVAVGLGSAVIATKVMVEKLDTRVTFLEDQVITEKLVNRTHALESQIGRHEQALDRDFARHDATVADISRKTDDQEKRLTRLEALFTETQALLSEIRTDVKILLRGGQQ